MATANGNALFAEGRLTEAGKAYTSALESSPPPSAAQRSVLLSNRAACHYARELYRKCAKDCDEAIAADPSNLRAYSFKGQAMMARKKTKDALVAWRAGMEAGKASGDVSVLLDLRAQIALHDGSGGGTRGTGGDKAAAAGAGAGAGAAPSELGGDTSVAPSPVAVAPPPAPPAAEAQTASSATALSARGAEGAPPAVSDAILRAKTATSLRAGERLPKKTINPAADLVAQSIMLGHGLVNAGQYKDAVVHFNTIVREHKDIPEAYIGRGSAYAMLGDFATAIKDFTRTIKLRPDFADAFKRRGQTRAAAGLLREGLADFAKAIELDPTDIDARRQRGMCLYQSKDYRLALADFLDIASREDADPETWNHIGLCYNQLGKCPDAVKAYERAIRKNPAFKDAMVNLGQCWRNYGNWVEAERAFGRALATDPAYVGGLHLRGLLYHGTGQYREALEDFHKGLMIKPTDPHCLFMAAVCLHAIGNYGEAVRRYDQLFSVEADHLGYCQRDIALIQRQFLDKRFDSYSFDNDLSPVIKEGFAKRKNKKEMPGSYRPQKASGLDAVPDVELADTPSSADVAKLVHTADRLGALLQASTPGFLRNVRQHRQFGLASLQMAQLCRAHWHEADGLLVPNVASSMPRDQLVSAGTTKPLRTKHRCTWRDAYDSAVRWRQISEPFDPVWWIDRLTRESFEDGFGLQTPMVSGQMEVVRYYPMFERAFGITKKLIAEQCPLTDEMRDAVLASTDCAQVYRIMKRDFWVVTPCKSTVYPDRTYEGTRLTIVAKPPGGYEFTIRTACLPHRAKQFDEELAHYWAKLSALMAAGEDHDVRDVEACVMALFFYWCNLGPLTRGSAAVGLAGLVGMSLAAGLRLNLPLPEGKQLDWEAILTPTVDEFVSNTREWVFVGSGGSAGDSGGDSSGGGASSAGGGSGSGSGGGDGSVPVFDDDMPSVMKTLPTLRAATMAMNALHTIE